MLRWLLPFCCSTPGMGRGLRILSEAVAVWVTMIQASVVVFPGKASLETLFGIMWLWILLYI